MVSIILSCEMAQNTLICELGDIDDEEESAMASANDQRESDFQVFIVE